MQEELQRLKEDGRVRAVGMSCHNRKFAGELAERGALDVFMMRYNAAHRGAEQDIFPHLADFHPGVVSYTATRWSYLLRRPRGWPKDGRIPTAAMCYRFVLSNPARGCLHDGSEQPEAARGEPGRDPPGPAARGRDAIHARTSATPSITAQKWFM